MITEKSEAYKMVEVVAEECSRIYKKVYGQEIDPVNLMSLKKDMIQGKLSPLECLQKIKDIANAGKSKPVVTRTVESVRDFMETLDGEEKIDPGINAEIEMTE